jgi:hypothetical protein
VVKNLSWNGFAFDGRVIWRWEEEGDGMREREGVCTSRLHLRDLQPREVGCWRAREMRSGRTLARRGGLGRAIAVAPSYLAFPSLLSPEMVSVWLS